ncbi:hypothetical protein QUF88_15135 [Bacillus sp. DX1.1]|uniref:hypothetical protein n=1 Tax=unclassified Bacillus (in: firmicutes) TaxID=185979 RepID=UPI002570F377|nr:MULTISPECIES: hypothetical protein [unclassified Bacillus (in: firmicutes)]MDM5155098.1 hypothetical protein [Bacillus sp. DX1.1]WJE83955.1 hypothetical protein QRE67_12630 [Bacillus sp. DX3.1]
MEEIIFEARENQLYTEFIEVAKVFNKELQIVPVLYGLLGLQVISQINFSSEDIDILVPLEFSNERWSSLRKTMVQLGYTLVDLHEHTFEKYGTNIGIAFIEDLAPFADVDYKNLEAVTYDGATYQVLSLEDYFKVYSKSLHDGYRRTKNNSKDLVKIHEIKKLLYKKEGSM